MLQQDLRAALERFFLDNFTPEYMHILLERISKGTGSASSLADELPGAGTSKLMLTHTAADILVRHRAVDATLFAHISYERPELRAEIDTLLALTGVEREQVEDVRAKLQRIRANYRGRSPALSTRPRAFHERPLIRRAAPLGAGVATGALIKVIGLSGVLVFAGLILAAIIIARAIRVEAVPLASTSRTCMLYAGGVALVTAPLLAVQHDVTPSPKLRAQELHDLKAPAQPRAEEPHEFQTIPTAPDPPPDTLPDTPEAILAIPTVPPNGGLSSAVASRASVDPIPPMRVSRNTMIIASARGDVTAVLTDLSSGQLMTRLLYTCPMNRQGLHVCLDELRRGKYKAQFLLPGSQYPTGNGTFVLDHGADSGGTVAVYEHRDKLISCLDVHVNIADGRPLVFDIRAAAHIEGKTSSEELELLATPPHRISGMTSTYVDLLTGAYVVRFLDVPSYEAPRDIVAQLAYAPWKYTITETDGELSLTKLARDCAVVRAEYVELN